MRRSFSICALMVLVLSMLLPLAHASKPALFCKCAWKYNSTIIALNVAETQSETKTGESAKKVHTCADCSRKTCTDYEFKWMKEPGYSDDEIVTTCFQRDSVKDQAVVYTFILVTIGLLVYAGVRPLVEKRVDSSQDRARYAPMSSGQNS